MLVASILVLKRVVRLISEYTIHVHKLLLDTKYYYISHDYSYQKLAISTLNLKSCKFS